MGCGKPKEERLWRAALPADIVDIYVSNQNPSEVAMRIFKWGNDLAVQIPEELVHALDLKDGDEIDGSITRKRGVEADRREVASTMSREQALERIRALARPFPAGWKFDREKADRR